VTSGPTLAHLTGLTLRQIQHWTTAGYLTPTGKPHPGQGHPHTYLPDQVTKAWLMAGLLDAGFTPYAAHITADLLEAARHLGFTATPAGPFDLGYERLLCELCCDWLGPGQPDAAHPECLAEAIRDHQPRPVEDVADPDGRFS
jgi:hypothetical protein